MISKIPDCNHTVFQSSWIKKLSIVTAGAALVIFGIIGEAQVGTAQTITFEDDTTGPKPNGFQSVQSPLGPLVSFTDSIDSDLEVQNFIVEGESQGQSLRVAGDDVSRLILNFSPRPVTSLSFNFGNDDPNSNFPGDIAQLQAFNNGTLVGTSQVPLNLNNLPDQLISFSNGPFNSAVFAYGFVDGGQFVAGEGSEVVDNVTFAVVPEPIPEPSSILGLLTFGAFGAVAILKRKRQNQN